jgi:hypothetical protein
MNAPGKSVTAPGSDVDAFDALPTQTAVLDSDGVIRRTNRAWREFGTENGLGDPEGAVGSNYITVCERSDDPDAEAVTEGLRGLLAGDHEAFAHEYPCHDPEGEQRWFLMRAIPFGPSPNVLVMHLDITERKLAELEVTAQNDRLETLTAVLSHDVRNPLNVAQMRAGELAETVDSEHLEPILESLDRIESILDSATVLSRGDTTGYNFVEYFDTTGCQKSPRDYSRQYQYYLGLASVNLGLIAAAAVGAWPLHLLPDIAWGAFVGTTVFVSALVHIYHDTSQQLGEHTKPPEIRDR